MCLYPKRTGEQTCLLRSQLSPDECRLPIDFSIDPVAVKHLHSGHRNFTVKVSYKLEVVVDFKPDITFTILGA